MNWIKQAEGHRWLDWSPHPARVPPPTNQRSGRCDVHLYALLTADRLELGHGWCWSSGHAEIYEEASTEVLKREEHSDWPAAVRRALHQHLGPEASRQASPLLEANPPQT